MTSLNSMTIIRVFNNIDQLLHSLSNSMNQEQQNQASYVNQTKDRTPNQLQSQNNQLQDEVLEEEYSSEEQSLQDSQQSQNASQDQLLQKPAFFINEEKLMKRKLKQYPNQQQNTNQKQKVTEEPQQSQICDDLEEDEVDAFLYLLQVRKEKKSLLQDKKKSKKVKIFIQKPETINNQETIQQKDKRSHQNYVSCSNAVLSNFNILIANLKYLIKTSQSYRQNSKPKNTQLFSSINLDNSDPKVYELMHLTVGQIEELMKKLSHQIIPKSKCVKDRNENIKKFCLWMYTLLSLHQAWSSYKHFSELAQVNFTLQHLIALVTKKTLILNQAPQLHKKQEQNNHKLDEINSGQSKPENNLPYQRVPNSLLTLLILLIQVFEQKHLTKHISNLFSL